MRDYYTYKIIIDLDKEKNNILSNIVKTDSECWEWQKSRNSLGYGKLNRVGQSLAHRVSYIIFNKEEIDSKVVMHSCDNPSCVNPDHLSLGTKADNNRDKSEKGRGVNGNTRKTHCNQGHEFTEENTHVRRTGHRNCRECQRILANKKYQETKIKSGCTKVHNGLKTHCKRGHEFTKESTYVNPQGHRTCRNCKKRKT